MASPNSLRLPSARRGRRLYLLAAAALLSGALLSTGPLPVPADAAGIPDQRFGVVEAYAAPGAAWELGAGWERITFRWSQIQPNGPGEWNVTPLSDDALALELAYGRELVGLLIGTPSWATDWSTGAGVPEGLNLPVDDVNNLWAGFVRSIVTRYAGRINHWTIWNEPDIPPSEFMTWGGSIDDFAQLLRVAYTVSKQVNPGAVIHLPGVSHYWNERWFQDLMDTLVADPQAEANGYYFDVATLHVYFRPEAVYELTTGYYRVMRDRGISKPIWIAETNAAPSEDPYWPVVNPQFRVTLQDQASYVIQAFTLGIAAGAGRMAVYNMVDDESALSANPEPYGLLRSGGTRRPAFTAFQIAAARLSGFRSGSWERRDDISLVTIDRDWHTTTVVWSRTAEPQQAIIPARTTRALRVDSLGAATYVYPERGYYFIHLAGANCSPECLIGGPPVMLVEEAPVAAPTARAPSSPTPKPTESAQTATPSPTQAPRATAVSVATSPAPPTAVPSETPTPAVSPTATSTSLARPHGEGQQAWLLAAVVAVVMAMVAFAGGNARNRQVGE
jgi:hypothetical protein